METSKEEMMQLLQELQDLQQWLYDSLHKIVLDINLFVFVDSISIRCYACLFQDISGTGEGVSLYSLSSYEENRAQLNYFVKYVKKLAKYGYEKGKSNQTPT